VKRYGKYGGSPRLNIEKIWKTWKKGKLFSPSDQRSFLLKETSTLQKMSPDSTDIEAENNIKRTNCRS
jgi:hypothetical protein